MHIIAYIYIFITTTITRVESSELHVKWRIYSTKH